MDPAPLARTGRDPGHVDLGGDGDQVAPGDGRVGRRLEELRVADARLGRRLDGDGGQVACGEAVGGAGPVGVGPGGAVEAEPHRQAVAPGLGRHGHVAPVDVVGLVAGGQPVGVAGVGQRGEGERRGVGRGVGGGGSEAHLGGDPGALPRPGGDRGDVDLGGDGDGASAGHGGVGGRVEELGVVHGGRGRRLVGEGAGEGRGGAPGPGGGHVHGLGGGVGRGVARGPGVRDHHQAGAGVAPEGHPEAGDEAGAPDLHRRASGEGTGGRVEAGEGARDPSVGPSVGAAVGLPGVAGVDGPTVCVGPTVGAADDLAAAATGGEEAGCEADQDETLHPRISGCGGSPATRIPRSITRMAAAVVSAGPPAARRSP